MRRCNTAASSWHGGAWNRVCKPRVLERSALASHRERDASNAAQRDLFKAAIRTKALQALHDCCREVGVGCEAVSAGGLGHLVVEIQEPGVLQHLQARG